MPADSALPAKTRQVHDKRFTNRYAISALTKYPSGKPVLCGFHFIRQSHFTIERNAIMRTKSAVTPVKLMPVDLAPNGASATQSLDRAMELLDAVVAHAVEGVSLGTLAGCVGLSKPTAHRLLSGLRNASLVDYDAATRLFYPAFKLHRMGQAAGARFDVVQLASAGLDRLAHETGDTIYLVLRSGDFAVCAARTSGAFPIKTLTLNVGDVRPLGLGSNGVVLLAAQPDEECERIAARHIDALSAYPAFDATSLRHHIRDARTDGYALNQGLMLPEMAAVAMGIRGPGGRVDASISVAAITSRMQKPRLSSIVQLLRDEIAGIERLITAQSDQRRAA